MKVMEDLGGDRKKEIWPPPSRREATVLEKKPTDRIWGKEGIFVEREAGITLHGPGNCKPCSFECMKERLACD